MRAARLPLTLILDPDAGRARHVQLREAVRMAILDGRLAPGARLPASRALAEDFGCARGTVLLAIEQLIAEGYLDSRPGSGTYVARDLPDQRPLPVDPGGAGMPPRPPGLAATVTALQAGAAAPRPPAGFTVGMPAPDAFPHRTWARLLEGEWRQPASAGVWTVPAFGHDGLREAIAAYLAAARGFRCDPAAIVITSGIRDALGLITALLLDPGSAVRIEEPGFPGLADRLRLQGLVPVPVPVDHQGMAPELLAADSPPARLAVVTPANHYPLGAVMSLPRRLALLRWAEAGDGWILEDDYDAEYRYAGRPLAPLRALDRSGRVAYAGSFSKVLFPALRLGYLVLPDALVDPARRVIGALGVSASALGQAALARFIADGHFAAHLRRTRRLYAERQAALVQAGADYFPEWLKLAPADAGMHLIARPRPDRFDDRALVRRAAAAGIGLGALSSHYLTGPGPGRSGLLLGYTALPPARIRSLAAKLATLLPTVI